MSGTDRHRPHESVSSSNRAMPIGANTHFVKQSFCMP